MTRQPGVAMPTNAEVPARGQYRDDLKAAESNLYQVAELARIELADALRALAANDRRLCEQVITNDVEVDRCYRALEEEVVGLIALQAPAASDLRLLIAILYAGLHVERIGDTAANIAEVVAATSHLPRDPQVLLRLEQMGQVTLDVIDTAMAGFTARDLHGCEQLPVLDDRVDALHAGMIEGLIHREADPDLLPWRLFMLQVSRHLERAADHAVDIGEQACYLMTGELRDFSGHSERASSPS